MKNPSQAPYDRASDREALWDGFSRTRADSMTLSKPLSAEDQCVQSMPDVSPMKWHLAHVTWFWETFLLEPGLDGYEAFDDDFCYLFNSYYEQVGARHPRPERGLLTRPSLDRIEAYRAYVDAAVETYFDRAGEEAFNEAAGLIALGLAHEQQHQELMMMDIKHVLSRNALAPTAYPAPPPAAVREAQAEMNWVSFDGGLMSFGADETGFSFDCERPRHQRMIAPFRLADRPVTNGEYQDFIEDGGYDRPTLWLSDGWDWVQTNRARRPLYWGEDGSIFTLHGNADIDPDAPVCHLTYYEADAFAEWAMARLPREEEWECAATGFDAEQGEKQTKKVLLEAKVGRVQISSIELKRGAPHYEIDRTPDGDGLRGLSGGVWEWTMSAFSPYPGFQPMSGAAGEYNGKFMSGQFVLRGGCCATPRGHARASYRNFFYPHMAWQFGGLRLARDV